MYLVLKSTDSNREAVRDRFLLSLLYESGARINEVLSLKLLDIKAPSLTFQYNTFFRYFGMKTM